MFDIQEALAEAHTETARLQEQIDTATATGLRVMKERDAALEALEEARQFREKIQKASDQYGYSHSNEFMDVIFAILSKEGNE